MPDVRSPIFNPTLDTPHDDETKGAVKSWGEAGELPQTGKVIYLPRCCAEAILVLAKSARAVAAHDADQSLKFSSGAADSRSQS